MSLIVTPSRFASTVQVPVSAYPFTFAIRVKRAAAADFGDFALTLTDFDAANQFINIRSLATPNIQFVIVSGAASSTLSSGTLSVDTWYDVYVRAVSTTERRLYIGTTEVAGGSGLTAVPFPTGLSHAIIGAQGLSSGFTGHWEGGLAEAMILNDDIGTDGISLLDRGVSPHYFDSLKLYQPLFNDWNNPSSVMEITPSVTGTQSVEKHIIDRNLLPTGEGTDAQIRLGGMSLLHGV